MPRTDDSRVSYWFFNTNETNGPGAYRGMFRRNVAAIWGYPSGPHKLQGAKPGDRVLAYVNRIGVMAVGTVLTGDVVAGTGIFSDNNGRQRLAEFHLAVHWDKVVGPDQAITPAQAIEAGCPLPVRCSFGKMRNIGTITGFTLSPLKPGGELPHPQKPSPSVKTIAAPRPAQAGSLSPEDSPSSLGESAEQRRRLAMVRLPHMAPLDDYIQEVQASILAERGETKDMPHFDPCDGGINARVLFLLQSPGPQSSKLKGSGFISRNNADPTANHLLQLMQDAGIPREETLLWNTVPWYLGDADRDAPISRADFDQAMPYLSMLLRLLPRLELIVLVGADARRAAPTIAAAGDWKIVATHHMSAKVWNREEMRTKIEGDFRDVAAILRMTGTRVKEL